MYADAHMSPRILRKSIIEEYGVNTLVSLIAQTRELSTQDKAAGYEDVAERYLPRKKWAR